MTDAEALFRLPGAVFRDPAVEAWFFDLTDPFRLIAREWFLRIRACGPDVRELLHDGRPTACVEDAAFAYVGAYKAHASVGFFRGSALADPERLLDGGGKRMRHVRLGFGTDVDEAALADLITSAYEEVRARLRHDSRHQADDQPPPALPPSKSPAPGL